MRRGAGSPGCSPYLEQRVPSSRLCGAVRVSDSFAQRACVFRVRRSGTAAAAAAATMHEHDIRCTSVSTARSLSYKQPDTHGHVGDVTLHRDRPHSRPRPFDRRCKETSWRPAGRGVAQLPAWNAAASRWGIATSSRSAGAAAVFIYTSILFGAEPRRQFYAPLPTSIANPVSRCPPLPPRPAAVPPARGNGRGQPRRLRGQLRLAVPRAQDLGVAPPEAAHRRRARRSPAALR
jgi:hypothetical protein